MIQSSNRIYLGDRVLFGVFVIIILITIGLVVWNFFGQDIQPVVSSFFTTETLLFIGVGFLAQTIDGALGMAYGISCSSLLLSLGVSPAAASASVHIAEVFTSGASGLSHWRFGNVNKKLFKLLLIPGIVGALTGAYLLSSFDGNIIKPYISAYLLVMGIVVISKALRKKTVKKKTKYVGPLALLGGFVDAVGGGGWGPVVTSTLIGSGRQPRYTIGSVNTAEFFIAAAGAGMFTLMIGIDNWNVVVGILIGGVLASPFAAYVCGKVNPKTLMLIVGIVIITLSLRNIISAF
ncbi:sulfite exporter TauE/SafE family protein [Runella sp. MFBS21]|uniref:sulfite exporter TauE/SafE family protein n=1 Tax=Runella sp. MFBS21 TaxID=3034018 RepID=UPI0023F6BD5C|nr:sulfite exporter TauE/SafE family protein [Runella sp. MFBS21]MDF7819889.1 sulfite exporter TauE/SafE family protein [Runella sp. MFBS21]